MSSRIFHVGLMKSGTTYIQEVLSANRDRLQVAGWDYPGKRLNQQHACYSICGSDIPWLKKPMPPKLGVDLKKKLQTPKNNVVISAEALSTLSDEGVARFIGQVGRPDKVVFTVRSLFQTLPSAWQQYLKGGGRTTFIQFIERLKDQRKDLSGFWRTYSYGHAIRRWVNYSDVDVVVVPATSDDPRALLDLFRVASGLPELAVGEITRDRQNVSLSLEAAHILRHLNKSLPKNQEASDRIRSEYLARAVMPQLNLERGTKIRVPVSCRDVIEGWNEIENRLLEEHSTHVYGQLGDLHQVPDEIEPRKALAPNDVAKLAAKQIVQLLQSTPVDSTTGRSYGNH